MIELADVSKSFGEKTLWTNVNYTFSAGQVYAITGRSGSGKSTLLNCIGGLDRVDSGDVLVGGTPMSHASARERRKLRRTTIGYLFQGYALVSSKSVEYNLRLAQPKASEGQCEDALGTVGLSGYAQKITGELSGGEQQRVALARLIISPRSVVLADEPTGALDKRNGEMVVSMLRQFADKGSTVIVSTHSAEVAAAADAVLNLDNLDCGALTQ